MTLAPETVERFRRDLEALTGTPPSVERKLALAVSGGPDSMAMLALAHAAFPGNVIAATVDHRLRAEAADEAAMVGAHCSVLGVPHETLVIEISLQGASIQAQAREVRYALLRDWIGRANALALATAHHADDQAETFLMRAVRGSGVGGLAGIRARRELRVGMDDRIPLIRPLLGWRRTDLRIVVERAAMPFAEDASNHDRAYDRVRFRQLLAQSPELDAVGIAASAAYAAEAEQTLADLAAMEWIKRRNWDSPLVAFHAADLPRGLSRRLVRTAIAEVRAQSDITAPDWSDGANVEALLDALEGGRGATQAGVMATAKGDLWVFRPAPPRRSH
ncbi:MAG: tRNA lysidine(34) synthetase TilS [Pseudomonadota bacterium]